MIQDEIDKNTLPDTITIGGYTTGNFDINKNYDSLLQLGTIKIGTGHFITTTGQKFKIENSEEIVTNLASNSSRTKYILFVGADKSRFNMLDQILTNGLKAISTEDGRTTIEITETGEANLDLKNFTLRAGGTIKMQGVVTFESLDNDMQENFTQVEGKTTINGDNIKTGVITANNNVSEFNLNSGTFRLGGTGPNDYKLYFDGENLNFADGAIQWPEIPNIEIPGLDDLVNHSVSLSKDTIAIKVDSKGTPEENEIGINGKAVSAITVHRSNVMLTGVDESVSVLGKDEFKYIITRTVNCVAGRKSNNEIYIESIENNRAVLGIEEDYGIIDEYF